MHETVSHEIRRYACLIPHFSRARILALPQDGRWTLPTAVVEGPGLRNPTPKLRVVLRACGIEDASVSLVRFARLSRELTIWECQNDDESWRPPAGARWVGRDELDGLELADPTVRTELESWFEEFGNPPPGRAPWECEGWWQGPMQWIVDQLPADACPVVDRTEGGKVCSPWNYVVRIRAAGGGFFFKAVRAWNSYEPRLTHTLARLFPEDLPAVLAVDECNGWILMEDFGKHLRRTGEAPNLLRGCLRRFAELQIESLEHLDAIVDAGCPDGRRDQAAELDALFNSIAEVLADSPAPAVAETRAKVGRALDMARSVASKIQRLGIPHALVHGDFTWINIGVRTGSGRHVYFDWGGSSIAHPFICMAQFARHCEQWEELLPAYLEPWAAFGPPDRLRQAFELSRFAHSIHKVRKHVRFLPHLEMPLAEKVRTWIADLIDQMAADS